MLRNRDESMGPFTRMLLRNRARRRTAGVVFGLLCLLPAAVHNVLVYELVAIAGGLVIGGQFLWGAGRQARSYGMVKPLSDIAPAPHTITLGLSEHSDLPERLDERERVERDHAHFLAYWILAGMVFALMLASRVAPIGLWTLGSVVLLACALPAMVILWTEPDPPGEPRTL